MRIAGVRVSPQYARLLAQMLVDAGYDDTARTIIEAIALETLEPAFTLQDHEAILVALGTDCPSGLARLRRELLEDQRLRWRTHGP